MQLQLRRWRIEWTDMTDAAATAEVMQVQARVMLLLLLLEVLLNRLQSGLNLIRNNIDQLLLVLVLMMVKVEVL